MAQFTLTVIDTRGIQDYIFGSNRLRENVGASFLVAECLSTMLYEVIAELVADPSARNIAAVPDPGTWRIDPDWRLEQRPTGRVELVYAGGGNALLLSRDHADAQELVAILTRRALLMAPGLTLIAAHARFDWETHPIGGASGAYYTAQAALAVSRLEQLAGPLHGLGVTLSCRSSGLPAIGFDPEEPERPVSAPILAKVRPELLNTADERLRDALRDAGGDGSDPIDAYGFSRDFDDLGRERDDTSYIAVIHADGNQMGKRFQLAVRAGNQPGAGNRIVLDDLRAFSHAINAAGEKALRRSVREALLPALSEARLRRFAEGLQRDELGRHILPLRPLVFGGDDLTVVADGRIGLALASVYLTAFEAAANELIQPYLAGIARRPAAQQALGDDQDGLALLGAPITACAGVAIVKSHYPFSRAYELSAALCAAAKDAYQRETSALDWHIASVDIAGSLRSTRVREYSIPEHGNLTMRPVALGDAGWRSWPWLTNLLDTLEGDEWSERRNKVLALREALRAGPNAVRRFLVAYGLERQPLPEPTGNRPELAGSGWFDDTGQTGAARCLYFDAIELLDLYLPLRLPEVTSA